MTDEECFEVLRNAAWLGTDHGMSVLNAVESLMKDHELKSIYRWHDLRKNPDDLPYDDSIEYIVCVEYRSGKRECTIGCLDMGGEMMLLPALGNWIRNGYHIIAWREVEPFEEVSE